MALPLKLHCRQWLALRQLMVARQVLLMLLTPLPLPMLPWCPAAAALGLPSVALPLKLHCQWLTQGK